jgi:hypothetical protein
MSNVDDECDIDLDLHDINNEYLDKSRLRNHQFSSQTQSSNDAAPSQHSVNFHRDFFQRDWEDNDPDLSQSMLNRYICICM